MFTLCDEDTKSLVNDLTARLKSLKFKTNMDNLLAGFPPNPTSAYIRMFVQPLIQLYDSMVQRFNSMNEQVQGRATASECISDELRIVYTKWINTVRKKEENHQIKGETTAMKKKHKKMRDGFNRQLNLIMDKMDTFCDAADIIAVKALDLYYDDSPRIRTTELHTAGDKFMRVSNLILNLLPNAEKILADFYKKRLLCSQIIMGSGESFKN